MDKKVGVSILFGFLLLVGLTYAGTIDSADDSSSRIRSANISVYGDGFSNDSTTKGGASEIINLTITYGGPANGEQNISNISITWSGNFSFDGWVATENGDEDEPGCSAADGTVLCGDNESFSSNVTLANGNEEGLWNCTNFSSTSLRCTNLSVAANLGPTGNTSLMIRFNATAESIEDINNWTITVSDGSGAQAVNATSVDSYLDGLAPRMIEFNVTDGNSTLLNGTGDASSLFYINNTYPLDNESDWTIFATVADFMEDSTSAVLWLIHNESVEGESDKDSDIGNGNLTTVPGDGKGSSASINASAGRIVGTIVNDWKDTKTNGVHNTQTALVKWVLPKSSRFNFNTTQFAFLFNDSYDQGTAHCSEDQADCAAANVTFKILQNGSSVSFGNVNLSDGVNTVSGSDLASGTKFLTTGNLTLTAELFGEGLQNVTVYINETKNFTNNPTDLSLGAPFINGEVLNSNDEFTEATTDYVVRNITAHNSTSGVRELWQTNIKLTAENTTQTLALVIVANSSFGRDGEETDSEDSKMAGIIGGPYFVKMDSTQPSATLNTPLVKGISTSDSITYICTGSDSGSGVGGYTWTLVKPNGDKITDAKVESGAATNTRKFSGNEVSSPGTHTVKCKVHDTVGNTKEVSTSSSNHFTVSVTSSGSGGSGSSGSGGAAVSFDVDFSTSPQATFKASQGRIKSFSFDGATKHTITFNEITATSATLIVASDPVTVKLNVGQSKDVDVNADGVNDMKVTLNSVSNGVADVTVTKIEEGAMKVKEQEEKARGVEPSDGSGSGVSPVAGSSLAWLWWTLIVIVAIVAIGYFVNQRK
jgi:hypothetical protein